MSRDLVRTLQPEELNGFLSRTRKGDPLAHFEHRLADDLRDILQRAGEFVPAQGGAVLLDDPRAKRGIFASNEHGKLTVIACFGTIEPFELGSRFAVNEGFAGTVYTTGDASLAADVLGVPIVIGESTCGVLLLRGAKDGDATSDDDGALRAFTERHLTLLRVFGDYISSTVQNALDAHKARELLRRDSLTGLYNDRYLYPRLEEEIVRAEGEGSPLALLFIDLDDFKKVNDRFGHLAGSRTLREVALVLRRARSRPARSLCVTAVTSSWCFCPAPMRARLAVSPKRCASRSKARRSCSAARPPVCPRTRRSRSSPNLPTRYDRRRKFTSRARSAWPRITSTSTRSARSSAGRTRFLFLADSAMYVAKTTGKNQVRLANPEL